jgi:hypothetical protein
VCGERKKKFITINAIAFEKKVNNLIEGKSSEIA